MNPQAEHKKGPMIATLVVVLVLVIAALYLFASVSSNKNQQNAPENTNVSVVTPVVEQNTANVTEAIKPVTNTSDELNDINADLNNSLDGLDKQNL
jgi:flagellar basal body-associated protein FliL